jgi:general secretion pathway protein A
MSKTIFDFFGLRENPFKINPDPRFMFLTPEARAASDELIYGIQHRKGLILLTGEVGTGKTMLVRHLLNWLSDQKMPTALIFNARLSSDNLLDFVLNDFGISCKSANKSDKLICLNNWLLQGYRADRIPVLVVDEAQGLPIQVLEEIRLLLNFETPRDKLLQIVLAGQPELDDTLKRYELRQLRQRITIRCKTAPLSFDQTNGYVRERLRIAGAKVQIFAPDSLAYLYSYSRGIPRILNVLCERALMNAFAEDSKLVRREHVESAAQDSQLEGVDSISRVLNSGSVTTGLDGIDSILAGVSQHDGPAEAPSRPRVRRRFPIESEASADLPSRSEQPFVGSTAPEFTLSSAENFSRRQAWNQARSSSEATVDATFPQRAVAAREGLGIEPRLRKITASPGSMRYWLRGWSKSFSADMKAFALQTGKRLGSARLRYWLPVRRDLRRSFERLQDSAIRFANDPRWKQWQSRLSRYAQAALREFPSWVRASERIRAWCLNKIETRRAMPKKPSERKLVANSPRVASLRRWLRQPIDRRTQSPSSAAARGQTQNESPPA